jgi:hypothetical protein
VSAINPLAVPAAQQRKAIAAAIAGAVAGFTSATAAGAPWWGVLASVVGSAAVAYGAAFTVGNDAPAAPAE